MRSIGLLGLVSGLAVVPGSPIDGSATTAPLASRDDLPVCTAGGSLLSTDDIYTALDSYCSSVANTVIHGPNQINSTLAVDNAPMAVTIEVCEAVVFTVDSLFCFTQFASIVAVCPQTESGIMTFSDPTVKLSLTVNPTDGQQPLPIPEEQNLAAMATRATSTLPDGMSCAYEGTPVDSYGIITNITEWCQVIDGMALSPNTSTNEREQDHAGTIWYPEILNLQLDEYHFINADLCTELFTAIVMSCQVDGKFYAGRWFSAPGPWIEHFIGVVDNVVPPAKWPGSSSKGKRRPTALSLTERAEPTCSGEAATGAAKTALTSGVAAACSNVASVSQQLPASGWSWTYFEPYDGAEVTYSWTSTGPFIQAIDQSTCEGNLNGIIGACGDADHGRWTDSSIGLAYEYDVNIFTKRSVDLAINELPANKVIVPRDNNNPACFPVTSPVSQYDLLPLMQNFCDNCFNIPIPPYTNIFDTFAADGKPVYTSVYNIGSNTISVDPGWCYNNFLTILTDCQEGDDAKQGGVLGDEQQRLEYTLYVNVTMPNEEKKVGGPSMAARYLDA